MQTVATFAQGQFGVLRSGAACGQVDVEDPPCPTRLLGVLSLHCWTYAAPLSIGAVPVAPFCAVSTALVTRARHDTHHHFRRSRLRQRLPVARRRMLIADPSGACSRSRGECRPYPFQPIRGGPTLVPRWASSLHFALRPLHPSAISKGTGRGRDATLLGVWRTVCQSGRRGGSEATTAASMPGTLPGYS